MAVEYGGNVITRNAGAQIAQFAACIINGANAIQMTLNSQDLLGFATDGASGANVPVALQIDGVAKGLAAAAGIQPGAALTGAAGGRLTTRAAGQSIVGWYLGEAATTAAAEVIPVLIDRVRGD